jgi:hypothetical protein
MSFRLNLFFCCDDGSWDSTQEEYSNLMTIGEKLKSTEVPFYDLTMIFKDYTETLYVDSCCHFGETGNLLMGREIANKYTCKRN